MKKHRNGHDILLIAFICFIGISTLAVAQDRFYVGGEEYNGSFQPVKRQLNYADIQGSAYLDDKLVKGVVKFNTGDSTVYFLRYNVYTDEMEYLEGEELLLIKNATRVDYIRLSGKKFVYREYYIRDTKYTGYLDQLVTNSVSLYEQYEVVFEPAKERKSSYDDGSPAQFVQKPVKWYYSTPTIPITQFSADNDGIVQIAGINADQVKAFIKENKLKFRKEEDLIAIFQFINTLPIL